MTLLSKYISTQISRPMTEVYEYVSDPLNLPHWAAGLSGAHIVKDGDQWLADSPMGKVRVQFTKKNEFGVVDHDVTLPNGTVVHNPLRVLKNNQGSEVVFTLFQQPGASDHDFNNDAALITKDLATLKSLLEKK